MGAMIPICYIEYVTYLVTIYFACTICAAIFAQRIIVCVCVCVFTYLQYIIVCSCPGHQSAHGVMHLSKIGDTRLTRTSRAYIFK